nr:thioredoxin-like domain-containing protein [uncultured Bacteroides sp.]
MSDLAENEYLLIIQDDPISKIDTLYPRKGKFTYQIKPDTLTLFRIVSPNGEAIPIVADRSWGVQVKGSFKEPLIEGDGPNAEYGIFLKDISKLPDNSPEVYKKAEEFIKLHPESFLSAYLINQYFIQTDKPDVKKIHALIQPLTGSIKDTRVLGVALKSMPDEKTTKEDSKYLNYFSCKDRNGKYVSWNSNPKGYTLVYFWASWDQASVTSKDSLNSLVKRLPKDKFNILAISLDYDKKGWLKKCAEDTPQWIESCDFKGWGTPLIKQSHINQLPANILIDRNRKILATNLYGEELYKKVDQLIKEQNKDTKK